MGIWSYVLSWFQTPTFEIGIKASEQSPQAINVQPDITRAALDFSELPCITMAPNAEYHISFYPTGQAEAIELPRTVRDEKLEVSLISRRALKNKEEMIVQLPKPTTVMDQTGRSYTLEGVVHGRFQTEHKPITTHQEHFYVVKELRLLLDALLRFDTGTLEKPQEERESHVLELEPKKPVSAEEAARIKKISQQQRQKERDEEDQENITNYFDQKKPRGGGPAGNPATPKK